MDTRTNIVLDDDLVAQAMARAKVKTKKAAIEAALRAFVRKPDYSGLLALQGSGVLADDYDPKALFTHPRYEEPLLAQESGVPYGEAPASPAKASPRKARPGTRRA